MVGVDSQALPESLTLLCPRVSACQQSLLQQAKGGDADAIQSLRKLVAADLFPGRSPRMLTRSRENPTGHEKGIERQTVRLINSAESD